MKRKIQGLILVFALCLLFSACQSTQAANLQAEPHGDFTGQVYGIARGFSAFIRVDLTLVNGMIVGVDISKAQGNETGGWWEVPFRDAPGIIIERNSAEVDTIAGATDTTRGIREAAKAALTQIPASP